MKNAWNETKSFKLDSALIVVECILYLSGLNSAVLGHGQGGGCGANIIIKASQA